LVQHAAEAEKNIVFGGRFWSKRKRGTLLVRSGKEVSPAISAVITLVRWRVGSFLKKLVIGSLCCHWKMTSEHLQTDAKLMANMLVEKKWSIFIISRHKHFSIVVLKYFQCFSDG